MVASLRVQRILWGALVMSTFMYLVVLQVVIRPPNAPDPTILYAVLFTSLGCAAASHLVPAMIGASALRRALGPVIKTRGDFHPDAMPNQRDAGLTRAVIENPDDVVGAAAPALQVRFILGMALAESVAVQGFLLAFLGFQVSVAASLFAVAWVLMALKFPRRGAMLATIERDLGVAFPEQFPRE